MGRNERNRTEGVSQKERKRKTDAMNDGARTEHVEVQTGSRVSTRRRKMDPIRRVLGVGFIVIESPPPPFSKTKGDEIAHGAGDALARWGGRLSLFPAPASAPIHPPPTSSHSPRRAGVPPRSFPNQSECFQKKKSRKDGRVRSGSHLMDLRKNKNKSPALLLFRRLLPGMIVCDLELDGDSICTMARKGGERDGKVDDRNKCPCKPAA